MAFRELRGLYREMYLREQIEQLFKIYSAAQKRLTAVLGNADATDFQKFRAGQLLRQVEVITTGLDRSAYKWAKSTMPSSYDRGIDLAGERLRALNVSRFVSYDAQIHTSAIGILVDDVTRELLVANDGVKKFFDRFILQTQQTLLQDKEISRMIAEGLIEGQARRTVSDTLLKELSKKMDNEQFIVINGRNYRPDKYAELVARTRTREATTRGTLNTALRYGVDYVQWDVHSEICEYCQQYAGRVYSISGTDPQFPALKESPPLHPNCKCVVVPVTLEHLKRQGLFDETLKLSHAPLLEVDSFSRYEELMATL